MINDMIIGILGVTYSSICILEGEKLIIKASNVPNASEKMFDALGIKDIEKGEPIVINSIEPLLYNEREKMSIHSIIGIPVYIGEIYRGYIIVEHSLYDFFNSEHMTYITSIANQIGIALENNFLYKKLRETAIKDPLLGIYNRRHFFEIVESKIERNTQRNFAIVMIDLDNFKRINDVYGHQVGDAVLIQTCKIIVDSVNKEDIVARYGGEEIVLYISNVQNHEEIFRKINDIRMKIFENSLEANGNEVNYSASFGIGYYEEGIRDLNKVLNIADTMLYNAKRWGKNMVVSA
jgi:diguanylate cyclase (GGDEF)-like protein